MIVIRLNFNTPYQNFQKSIPVSQAINNLDLKTGGSDIILQVENGKSRSLRMSGYVPVATPRSDVNSKSNLRLDFSANKRNFGAIFARHRPQIRIIVSINQLKNLEAFKVKTDGGNITIRNHFGKTIAYKTNLNGGSFQNKSPKNYTLGNNLILESNGGRITLS
ncbi:hypothetical protein HU830_02980 [Lactobacillus sp. DCY120]|uniref:Adhesin domain-containing protein n=1 Tax=Bombilactobacillus apium TaxID=2675299 RepID=A0A850R6H5_9LACO|nr:hypothetical protein [Bombilactobacillus apium]NVY96145.1 hypothetical protein [Bombilactobacillus apium]